MTIEASEELERIVESAEHHDECAWLPGNDECCSCTGRGPVPSNSDEVKP